MKVPLSWLKEYVDIEESIDVLCKKMVDVGLEIEELQYLGANVEGVKVCQIVEIAQHPNAEKLLCCKVDVGGEQLPIVTNDHHLKVGDKVPVALHNAHLANGIVIKKGKMRGEESWGMFCGPEELGITADFYPNADKDCVLVLSKNACIGADVRAEVGLDDYLLDINVPANRQDCNSVLGIAREVAAALGKTCRQPNLSYDVGTVATQSLVTVKIDAPDLCRGYYMQGVTDVKIERSPVWMTSRLAKVGLHGISNLVDITNYVLYEIGQPMHAFDYADISDKTIVVRRAQNGEKIVPLDGKEYTLCSDDLVIADNSRAVGLAGIMGGANSGIKPTTNCVLFESASFSRSNVRRTSRRLGLRSDSSARFEKGIETYTNNVGLSRALHLVQQLDCGKITVGRISVGQVADCRTVQFERSRIRRLLGIDIPDEKIVEILQSLNIKTKVEDGLVVCQVPPYREDIARDCDIVEELIRLYGYDKIEGTLLEGSKITCGGNSAEENVCNDVRNVLTGLRYNECIFYPFGGKQLFEKATLNGIDEGLYIRVLNPIGEELSLMNRSLAPNMLQCAALNLSRNVHNLKMFEIGSAYIAKSLPLTELPNEDRRISLCATEVEFENFRQAVLQVVHLFGGKVKLTRSAEQLYHPGICADVFRNGVLCGTFGKIHPQISDNFGIQVDCYYAELRLAPLMTDQQELRYEEFGKYPSVSRDFAFVADEAVAAQDILEEFLYLPNVRSAKLFDVYRGEQVGEGKKSLAVTVEFRAKDRTLKDVEVEKQCAVALNNVKEKYGAVLR